MKTYVFNYSSMVFIYNILAIFSALKISILFTSFVFDQFKIVVNVRIKDPPPEISLHDLTLGHTAVGIVCVQAIDTAGVEDGGTIYFLQETEGARGVLTLYAY